MSALARRPAAPPARIGFTLILAALLLLLLTTIVYLGMTLGTPQLTLSDLGTIVEGGGTRLARIVVTQIRAPRVLLGVTAGAMLALAGTLMQDAMRNPLAGPELIGVSAGASLVIAAITIFNLPVLLILYPWLALAGSLISVTIVLLSMRRMGDPVRLVLTGVAMGALLYAGIITIIVLGEQNDVAILYLYLLGSLANRTWGHLQLVLPWAIIGIPLALLSYRALNLLQLGDDMAEGLGLRVVRTRLLLVMLSAALVAAVVAVSGPIGYIALVSPHVARRLLRTTDARVVLPIAALIGSCLLAGADLIAKNLFDPIELPVGIWTTVIGGPLLLILLRRQLSARRATA
jgi:iron complex transport system permease protein